MALDPAAITDDASIAVRDELLEQFDENALPTEHAAIMEAMAAAVAEAARVVAEAIVEGQSALTAPVPGYTSDTRPQADAAHLGVFIRLKDASQPERLQICMRGSTGGYEWVTVALAGF